MQTSQPDEIPPSTVLIFLRLRWRLDPYPCVFHRHAAVQHQLDSELLRFNHDDIDPAYEDAVGILVDGTVYADDEPYWRNLLRDRTTYDIVYLRRSIWQRGLFVWLWDVWNGTPLIDAEDVPKRRSRYTTRRAYRLLVTAAPMVAKEPKPCMHSSGSDWLWNWRDPTEMREARERGRSVVYERMRLFNPAPAKID